MAAKGKRRGGERSAQCGFILSGSPDRSAGEPRTLRLRTAIARLRTAIVLLRGATGLRRTAIDHTRKKIFRRYNGVRMTSHNAT
jgi:hypothetical protein